MSNTLGHNWGRGFKVQQKLHFPFINNRTLNFVKYLKKNKKPLKQKIWWTGYLTYGIGVVTEMVRDLWRVRRVPTRKWV